MLFCVRDVALYAVYNCYTLRLGVYSVAVNKKMVFERIEVALSAFFYSRRGFEYIQYKSVLDKKKIYTTAISLFIKKSSENV